MPIIVTCPSCSTTLKAPDAAAGKTVKCPQCTSAILVAAAEPAPFEEPESLGEPQPIETEAPRVSNVARRRQDEANAGRDEPPPDWQSNRVVCGVVAILIGSLGIHKFILGNTTPALIMLLVSLLTCGVGAAVMHIIGIIEGVMYLTKTDAEFYRMYVVEKKPWL